MCQFWHIWFCKTRRISIFKHPGVYENRATFIGVAIALCIMIIAVYVPWLQARASLACVQVRQQLAAFPVLCRYTAACMRTVCWCIHSFKDVECSGARVSTIQITGK